MKQKNIKDDIDEAIVIENEEGRMHYLVTVIDGEIIIWKPLEVD